MAKRKAEAKSASLLDFMRWGSEASYIPCSPPRPSKPRRLATPQQKAPAVSAVSVESRRVPNRDQDDLWDYIWANVESPGQAAARGYPDASPTPGVCGLPSASPTPGGGLRPLTASPSACGKSPQTCGKPPQHANDAAIVPYVRKRLVGKQPAPDTLTIEVYVRRRLVGKQPKPKAPERKTISVRGHYDVLGIQRTATAAELHAAYRRRALATHPDKGGDPRDFHRVKSAYSELSVAKKRAAYDRSLVLFGRRDGLVSADEQVESTQVVAEVEKSSDRPLFGPARVAHFVLLRSSWNTWPAYLATMQDGVLSTLRSILKGAKTQAASDVGAGVDARGNLQGWQGPTCITQRKSGYKVTVSWEDLSVCTGFTKSLTQVIDWQIALLSMQGSAQLRMRQRSRGESRDPLTENELLQVLEMEPDLELVFTVGSKATGGKKICAPGVVNLHMANDFHRRFVAAASAKNSDAALNAEKRKAEHESTRENKRRKLSEQKLLASVNEELQARQDGQACGTADRSSKALVLHHASQLTPPPKGNGKRSSERAKISPCKVTEVTSRQRRTPLEAPVKASPCKVTSRQRRTPPLEAPGKTSPCKVTSRQRRTTPLEAPVKSSPCKAASRQRRTPLDAPLRKPRA